MRPMLPILSYQDLKMLGDFYKALEDIEHKIKSQTVTPKDEQFLTALEVFHKNWLKDQ